jgi:uncharacterized protein
MRNKQDNKERGVTVMVFARKPRGTQVKTRLARTVGSYLAKIIYTILLKRTIDEVAKVRRLRKIIMPSNLRDVGWFLKKYTRSGWLIRAQSLGGLGRRMARAIKFELSKGRAVILIGSDITGGQLQDIKAARDFLNSGVEVVVGPAIDGGYWLIAMQSKFFNIFEGMQWSHASVFKFTLEKLESENCNYQVLPPRQDVDTAQDLLRFKWRGYN